MKLFYLFLTFFCFTVLLSASNVKYLNSLAHKKYVTKGDCLRMTAYLLGKKNIGDFSDVVRFLKKKKAIRKNLKITPKVKANRGYLSQILVRALRVRWNLWGSLFGNKHRIAYRQLLAYRIVASGGWRYFLDGPELIGTITRAKEFQKGERLW